MTKKELWKNSIKYQPKQKHLFYICEFCGKELNENQEYLVILENYCKSHVGYAFFSEDSYVICENCFIGKENDN